MVEIGSLNFSVTFYFSGSMYSEQEQKHKNEIKAVFKEFCESTSLHGYSYLFIGKGPLYIWIPGSEGGAN